jgi:hypothetical protein
MSSAWFVVGESCAGNGEEEQIPDKAHTDRLCCHAASAVTSSMRLSRLPREIPFAHRRPQLPWPLSSRVLWRTQQGLSQRRG